MFTINIYVKFALIALFLGGGIILSLIYGFGYSWILIIIGLIFLLSYILLGTIQSASEMLQKMDFDGAEKRLDLTLKPGWLYVTNRAFYYILKGSLAANRKDNNDAEAYFQKALTLKLPTDNEKAMILLQMAGIQANKNNWTGAKNYFYQCKNLKVTEPTLKDQLKQFEVAINNRGQAKLAQSMGMKAGQSGMMGGKRRRPKMR
jgi:tetratricopeptide (TPR) repeat protein